jgi:hypothetical protein
MERRLFPLDRVPEERVRQAVSILTTEHFTVQSGRASTIAESNGRVSMFLTSTTGGMIAISFIGQSTHFGPAFMRLHAARASDIASPGLGDVRTVS